MWFIIVKSKIQFSKLFIKESELLLMKHRVCKEQKNKMKKSCAKGIGVFKEGETHRDGTSTTLIDQSPTDSDSAICSKPVHGIPTLLEPRLLAHSIYIYF